MTAGETGFLQQFMLHTENLIKKPGFWKP